MKRIIALFVVLSLLVVSASAAGQNDPYSVGDDTDVLMSPAVYSVDGVAVASDVTYDTVLEFLEYFFDMQLSEVDNTIFWIYDRLADTNTTLTSIKNFANSSNGILSSIKGFADSSDETLTDILGYATSSDGTLSDISGYAESSDESLSKILGYAESSDKLLADISGYFDLSNSYFVTLLDSVASEATLSTVFSALTVLGDKLEFLRSSGTVTNTSTRISVTNLVRHGFLGLDVGLDSIVKRLSGSETDNIYDGSLTTNENLETTFSAVGLGPMMQVYLDAMQNHLGLLSYMFASPADIEARKNSISSTESMSDNFLDPESSASVKAKDIGILKDSSDTIQSLGETGVTPGQAFSQLTGNSDLFSFFSQETANDLDTTVSAYSRDPGTQIVTSYYADSRAEFFDLIGKGGDE